MEPQEVFFFDLTFPKKGSLQSQSVDLNGGLEWCSGMVEWQIEQKWGQGVNYST